MSEAALIALVKEFVLHKHAQEKCVELGDVDTGNEHARRQAEVFDSLVNDYGERGVDSLASLLHSDDPSVRLSAAVFLLRRRHNEAMSVLRELALRKELGLISFGAKCSIRNWYTGDWEIDPGPLTPEVEADFAKYKDKTISEIPYGDWENP
jgi:hypothetical protein